MDHGHDTAAELGPWPLGWAIAIGAGAVAFVLATLGGAGALGAGVIAGVSLAVFGALLGAGGVERTAPPAHDDAHGGGHHGGHQDGHH